MNRASVSNLLRSKAQGDSFGIRIQAFVFLGIVSSIFPLRVAAQTLPVDIPANSKFGVIAPSPAQQIEIEKNSLHVTEVRPTFILAERLAAERLARNITGRNLEESSIALPGEELVVDYSHSSALLASANSPLPSSVDNSTLDAFPPIGDQASLGSCAAWSTAYYVHTYEYASAFGLNAKTGGYGNSSSPKWVYNNINGGEDGGSSPAYNLFLLSKLGAPTLADLPYDNDYWSIPNGAGLWRGAIDRRGFASVGSLTAGNFLTDALLQNVKTMLANGKVLEVSTMVASLRASQVHDDPTTSLDDAFVGQYIIQYNATPEYGGHSVTVVGYSDDIWTDFNQNGVVDAGEKGAFKIANQWGSSWGNSGFIWVSYDAMRQTSQVPAGNSWPPAARGGFFDTFGLVFRFLNVKNAYHPQVIAEITLESNNLRRNMINLGVRTSTGSSTYVTTLPILGNLYTSNPPVGPTEVLTIALDATELIAQSKSNSPSVWKLTVQNSNRQYASVALNRFALYQNNGSSDVLQAEYQGLPSVLNSYSQFELYNLNWSYSELNNQRPVSNLVAPAQAIYGSTIRLDASGSTDPDGAVYGYRFKFGNVDLGVQDSPIYDLTWNSPYVDLGDSVVAEVQAIDNKGSFNIATQNVQRVAVLTPTSTPTSLPSPTPTRTSTPLPTYTFTSTRTPTLTPTSSSTGTATTSPTSTPTPVATATTSPTLAVTSSATATGTSTPAPTLRIPLSEFKPALQVKVSWRGTIKVRVDLGSNRAEQDCEATLQIAKALHFSRSSNVQIPFGRDISTAISAKVKKSITADGKIYFRMQAGCSSRSGQVYSSMQVIDASKFQLRRAVSEDLFIENFSRDLANAD